MKYIDEIRKIRSSYEISILAHNGVSARLGHQYIPEGYVGILEPLSLYRRDGIYGARQILYPGDNKIRVILENHTGELISLEEGCVIAELHLLNVNKLP